MIAIKKIKFENFKKFRHLELDLNKDINIFIGDNGSGKSSILQGIDLALSGSVSKVENIGLEHLLNIKSVDDCLKSKNVRDLPRLIIEIFIDCDSYVPKNAYFYGEKNTSNEECYGVKLVCEPNDEFIDDIQQCLNKEVPIFPYELYKVYHATFADDKFNSYRKPLRASFIDSSEINSKYVIKNTIKDIYESSTTEEQRRINRNNYNSLINRFQFEGEAGNHGICISANLEDNLSMQASGVHIVNHGKGEINIIKISYILKQIHDKTDIILLEEPENHMSPCRMRHILQDIIDNLNKKQIFIATHSSLITSRLGLDNVFFVSGDADVSSLKALNKSDTAAFFKKAPSDNLLQFILSKKAILVEGAAEFLLMDLFYNMVTGHHPEQDDVWIISVNGLSFPRYLQIAKLIHNRVAVIRDNDKNKEVFYEDYVNNNISIFYDPDITRYTFEKSILEDNKIICDLLFGENDTLRRMMNNKTGTAYKLMQSNYDNPLQIPNYIKDAIEWIRK